MGGGGVKAKKARANSGFLRGDSLFLAL